MSSTKRHVLIIGLPSVGKTTIIKKLCAQLDKPLTGFYTEEVRDSRNIRIGFDVVAVDGTRGILARTSDSNQRNKYTVGKYQVYLENFEKCALPQLKGQGVLVIDEIGKMELFSAKFQQEVVKLFKESNMVIATVPLKCNASLVDDLKHRSDCQLFNVDKQNRDTIFQDILQFANKQNQ